MHSYRQHSQSRVYIVYRRLLGPAVPLIRALSGLLKCTVRHHKSQASPSTTGHEPNTGCVVVWGLGFEVRGSGVRFWVQVSGFRVPSKSTLPRGSGFRVQGSGCRVPNPPCAGQRAGCVRVRGVGFGVQLLYKNVQRFRGGLVFKAHRRLYHSTLGLRVIQKTEKVQASRLPGFRVPRSSVGRNYTG